LSDPKKRSEYDNPPQFNHGGFGGFDTSNFGHGGHTSFHRSSNMNFKRAEDIFKEFFGGRDPFANFFDDDDDDFFNGRMGGMSKMMRNDFFGDDDFFGGSGFPGGQMRSSSSTFSSNMGGGGMSTSTQTVTQIVNGQRVSKTIKTVK